MESATMPWRHPPGRELAQLCLTWVPWHLFWHLFNKCYCHVIWCIDTHNCCILPVGHRTAASRVWPEPAFTPPTLSLNSSCGSSPCSVCLWLAHLCPFFLLFLAFLTLLLQQRVRLWSVSQPICKSSSLIGELNPFIAMWPTQGRRAEGLALCIFFCFHFPLYLYKAQIFGLIIVSCTG